MEIRSIDVPQYLKEGERARLFPVLSETQKERRTLSTFLSCLASIKEFRETMMGSIGHKLGSRAQIDAFTEITFESETDPRADRPDGLILLQNGRNQWRALVEAKIGRVQLTDGQIDRYLELAKSQKIDAVITISNQFTPTPNHHPCNASRRLTRSVGLFHWSWMYVMTQAHLLSQKKSVSDADQVYILSEFLRFLLHPSAGVVSFTSMNPEWKEVVETIRTGGRLLKSATATQNSIASWHQESQDLSLKLTKSIQEPVLVRLSREERSDPSARLKNDIDTLCDEAQLRTEYDIPGAASPLSLCCDVRSRSISASMQLTAPGDRKSTSARVNWLLRQLKHEDVDGFYVRAYWPGRARMTQASISDLRVDPTKIQSENPSLAPTRFEVVFVCEAGARFSGPRSFIEEVERAVPHFYSVAGQHLRPWQAPPPKVKAEADDKGITSSDTADENSQDRDMATGHD